MFRRANDRALPPGFSCRGFGGSPTRPPSSPQRTTRRRGFTLLEVMISVVMITLVTVSVYRFVRANLRAISLSKDAAIERLELTGLIDFLQTQLVDLPPRQPGVLLGSPNKFKGLSKKKNSMRWWKTCEDAIRCSVPENKK